MMNCTCLVQAGQNPDRKQGALEPLLDQFCERAFGEVATVRWVAIAEGSGFTAGEPSTSSVVAMTAPEPLDQARRVSLLEDFCALWMDETGCSLDEIVVAIGDPGEQ